MNGLKKTFKDLGYYRSPVKILLIISLSIFAVETMIMGALLILSPETPTVYAFLDALVLVLLLSPMLYFFLLKPLIRLVDERDLAINDIKAARDRAQKYLDIAGVIILVVDREGRVLLINRKGCEVLGYTEREILGRDWFTGFIPRRMRDEVELAFKNLIAGEEEAEGYFENPVLTKSGEERTILWYNSILHEDGLITGTLSSGEDITERKRTEKSLKGSEIKYRSLHDTAFDAIIIADDSEHLTECNPSAEKMFGYGKGEMIGLQITSLMPEKYRARHTEKVRQFLSTGISTAMGRVLEMRGLRKNGEEFPIEIVLNTFVIAGSRYLTAMIRDITDRKKAEREKEIIQARLNQSQKMEAIGRFSGGIAHDFNNILSSIRGNAELALEGVDRNDPLYQRLDGIILSVMLASKLTRQLLLFSRSQPFELVPLDMNKTIEDLLVMITRLMGPKVTISTDLAPDLWIIEADEGTIEQVVMNLAVNASDAMPEGGTLSIKTRNETVTEEQCRGIPEAHPGDVVRLTVSDTGVGMEKDLVQRIFEPFFTTKEAGKGTGFGLWMVYSIVKQHGGWITVRSKVGVGTKFNIYLRALTKKQAGVVSGGARKSGLGEKILLVDSEQDMINFASMGLGEHGYNVFEARDAREALKLFKEHKGDFQLLVCDVLLPERNGITLAEHLRGIKPGLGVVMTCGYVDERLKPEVESKKFKYLRKPFSVTNLLTTVKEALDQIKM
ncbi:MAG: PAS domain S-box protein [Thermodesulfobacteriota bacterium]